MRRLPGGKTPSAPRLAGRSRYRELPDPELRPDQLQQVLPGDLTRIGCYRVYLTASEEIDQSVGHDRGDLQTVSGAKPESGVSCPGMQRVQNPLCRADKKCAGRESGWGKGLFLGLELPDALPGSRIQSIQKTVHRAHVDHALRHGGRASVRVLHLELPLGLARVAVQREDTPVLQAEVQLVPSDSRRRMDGTCRAYL